MFPIGLEVPLDLVLVPWVEGAPANALIEDPHTPWPRQTWEALRVNLRASASHPRKSPEANGLSSKVAETEGFEPSIPFWGMLI